MQKGKTMRPSDIKIDGGDAVTGPEVTPEEIAQAKRAKARLAGKADFLLMLRRGEETSEKPFMAIDKAEAAGRKWLDSEGGDYAEVMLVNINGRLNACFGPLEGSKKAD